MVWKQTQEQNNESNQGQFTKIHLQKIESAILDLYTWYTFHSTVFGLS